MAFRKERKMKNDYDARRQLLQSKEMKRWVLAPWKLIAFFVDINMETLSLLV